MDRTLDGLRVLVVEDDSPSLKLATTVLRLAGATVTGVTDGRSAVERAVSEDFDVVLMDVQIPVIDGREATARIRAAETVSACHIPIIGVTAHAMAEHHAACLVAGMDAVITKPVDPLTFASEVRACVDSVRQGMVDASGQEPRHSPRS